MEKLTIEAVISLAQTTSDDDEPYGDSIEAAEDSAVKIDRLSRAITAIFDFVPEATRNAAVKAAVQAIGEE